jgi:hypothetical protein
LATKTRPYGTEESKTKILEERDKELKFDMKYSRPMPDFNSKQAAVKLNTAAIIREEAQITKKQKDEELILRQFEMNLRDDSEY